MLDLIKHVFLEDDESIDESKVSKISKLSTTRWTVRANCFQRITDNYQCLYSLWDESLKETGLTTEVKSRIIRYKAQMTTSELYFGLKLGKLLYSHTDKLSQTLQSDKMAAVSSKRLAMLTIETIGSMQNEENFNATDDLCLKEIKELHCIEDPVLKRKKPQITSC